MTTTPYKHRTYITSCYRYTSLLSPYLHDQSFCEHTSTSHWIMDYGLICRIECPVLRARISMKELTACEETREELELTEGFSLNNVSITAHTSLKTIQMDLHIIYVSPHQMTNCQ